MRRLGGRGPLPIVAAAVVGLLVVITAGISFTLWVGHPTSAAATSTATGVGDVQAVDVRIPGTREADGTAVNLDATAYYPADRLPAPAVLLAHGYGGTKDSVKDQALELADAGYVVLTWSARGFGDSGGKIHLDAPGYEVADAKLLVDWLSKRSEVQQDAGGDPRVAVVGGSYGGALALMLAGSDQRVDAIVPVITWNDLRQALFPQFAVAKDGATAAGFTPVGRTGVFKKAWTGQLIGASLGSSGSGAQGSTTDGACGRLDQELCLGYAEAAQTGRPSARMLALLAASSPARVLAKIKAPTLLIQGQTDSLFPLSEADANAKGIAANGTPVALQWYSGGHDGGDQETDYVRSSTLTWLDHYLKPEQPSGPMPLPAYEVTVAGATVSSTDGTLTGVHRVRPEDQAAPGLPGGGTLATEKIALAPGTQPVLSPPGAYPSALTALPGVGSLLSQAATLLGGTGGSATGGSSDVAAAASTGILPGESGVFRSQPLTQAVRIVGGSRVSLKVTSSTTDATLFVSVVDQAPDGTITLPSRLVTPVRLTTTAGKAQQVSVQTPAIVRDVPAGHRLGVVVSSTDQGYAVPVDARVYQVALGGDGALTVPTVPMVEVTENGGTPLRWIALGMAVVTLGGILVALLVSRRRRHRDDEVPEGLFDGADSPAEIPLEISGLSKKYKGGFQAVTDLSFRVEPGQVLGLLGPNGAGKTTTLRMVMGLIRPTAGEIRVFGRRIRAGAPVLSRVGVFVEGPGFLPHLSGLRNLQLYWASTGRPLDHAHFAEALEVAGLGDDVERTVRTYSQGMRQRLAIAQAMLGLPDLLVLDEPTNGLDPPQIAEMREVLRRYAATGRTVVVSSHLLAEVEQTCSHVVVMHHGKLVAQGPVAQIVGASGALALVVDDPELAAEVALNVPGVSDIRIIENGIAVHSPNGTSADLVAALVQYGVRVERVAPRAGLEEAFLELVGRS